MKIANEITIGHEAQDIALSLMSFSLDYTDRMSPADARVFRDAQASLKRFIDAGHAAEDNQIQQLRRLNHLAPVI